MLYKELLFPRKLGIIGACAIAGYQALGHGPFSLRARPGYEARGAAAVGDGGGALATGGVLGGASAGVPGGPAALAVGPMPGPFRHAGSRHHPYTRTRRGGRGQRKFQIC